MRLYDALRLINHTIVHEQTRESLLQGVCRICVEFGGFTLAWFGWVAPDTQRVVALEQYGEHLDYLAEIPMYASGDMSGGNGPSGLCIRSGRPYICNDFHNDPATGPWREAAQRHQIRASATLPIRLNGVVVGIFGIYASETGVFGDREVELLEEAALDVSFALDNFAREEERTRGQEASRYLAAIVESSDASIMSLSLDRRIISWNSAAHRMFGYTADEVLGRKTTTLVPLEAMDEHYDLFRRLQAGERIVNLDTMRVGKSGRKIPVTVTLSPLKSPSGETIGYSKILRDMSDLKLAEATVRENEKRFEVVIESLDEGLIIMAREGAMITANAAARRMLELPDGQTFEQEGFTYATVFEVSGESTEGTPLRRWLSRKLSESRTFVDLEVRVKTRLSGVERTINCSGSMVQFALDKDLAFLRFQDITDKRLAEKQIEHLASFPELTPALILEINRKLEIVYINPTMKNLLSCVVSLDPVQLIPVRWQAILVQPGPIWEESETVQIEIGDRSYQMIFRFLTGSQTLRGYGLEITDLLRTQTALDEAQAQLLQSQKMEAVGQLAAGVAHDFNNILGVISGYSALLKKHIRSDDTGSRYLSKIQQAEQRAAPIIRQLLSFSRKQLANLATHDLNDAVAAIQEMLQRLLREDIHFEVLCQANPSSVRVDDGQIGQVLMNLVVNARDAMPEGGNLTLRTHTVRIEGEHDSGVAVLEPGDYVALSLSDTGCGMDPATKSRIFEPFFTTKDMGFRLFLRLCSNAGAASLWRANSEKGLPSPSIFHW